MGIVNVVPRSTQTAALICFVVGHKSSVSGLFLLFKPHSAQSKAPLIAFSPNKIGPPTFYGCYWPTILAFLHSTPKQREEPKPWKDTWRSSNACRGAHKRGVKRDEVCDGQAVTSTGDRRAGWRAANGQKVHFHFHKRSRQMKQISSALFPLWGL